MAITAEQVQQQLETLSQQVTARIQQVTTLTQQSQGYEARLAAADAAHQQLHYELNATKAQLAASTQRQ